MGIELSPITNVNLSNLASFGSNGQTCYTVDWINNFVSQQIHSLQLQNYALIFCAVGLALLFFGLDSWKNKKVKVLQQKLSSSEQALKVLTEQHNNSLKNDGVQNKN